MKYSNKLISIDWLEVFCREPLGTLLNAEYFKALGWNVTQRDYGTPQYREMFYINDEHGNPFLEIRRNPYSLKSEGGIFEPNDCHIRLSNRTCYAPNPIGLLRKFLIDNNYTYKGISRIDVCSDQVMFDNGMNPQNLCNDYIKEKIWKVHQSATYANEDNLKDTSNFLKELLQVVQEEDISLSAHGYGSNVGRIWNSLKWGSPRSAISTKIYNKTLEMKVESKNKLYIKDAWVRQGLCDLQKVGYDVKQKDGSFIHKSKMVCVKANSSVKEEIPIENAEQVNIWRVEFSLKSDGRNWIDLDKQHKINLKIENFDNPYKVAQIFYMIASWNFQFVHSCYTPQGKAKRKDRCKAIMLYNTAWLGESQNFKPIQQTTEETAPSRTEKIIANKLIKEYKSIKEDATNRDKQYKNACLLVAGGLLKGLHREYYMSDADKKLYENLIVSNETRLDVSEEDRINKINEAIDNYEKIIEQAYDLIDYIKLMKDPQEAKHLLRKLQYLPKF